MWIAWTCALPSHSDYCFIIFKDVQELTYGLFGPFAGTQLSSCERRFFHPALVFLARLLRIILRMRSSKTCEQGGPSIHNFQHHTIFIRFGCCQEEQEIAFCTSISSERGPAHSTPHGVRIGGESCSLENQATVSNCNPGVKKLSKSSRVVDVENQLDQSIVVNSVPLDQSPRNTFDIS